MGDVTSLPAPPHSPEAEQGILGALLLDGGAWPRVADTLIAGAFFDLAHRLIFCAIAEIVTNGGQVDIITVGERLKLANTLDDVGGYAYLNELPSSVPSAAFIGRHAEIVVDKARRRSQIDAADQMRSAAYVAPDADAAMQQALQIVTGLAFARPAANDGQALNFRSLAGQSAPPQTWFRDGWLHPGATLASGVGGVGKSALFQHEATCGALGRAYFAPACTPYRSMLWNCEDDHDVLWRRQERICEHEQIDMVELDGLLHIVSRYGCENALMAEAQRTLVATRLLDDLRQEVNDLNIDVLWLDNVAHLFLGNHDDRTQVTQFINLLNGLVRGRPFGVVAAGHVSRSLGSEYSGSVAWENAARMRWYLGAKLPDEQRSEDDAPSVETRVLAKRKTNYSARDVVRMTMRDGLLVPDAPVGHVGGLVMQLDWRKAEEAVIASFHSLRAMGLVPTDSKNSPDYLPRQSVEKGLGCGYGKAELAKALNRLMAAGVFSRGVAGIYGNRNAKQGLVMHARESA